MYELFEAKVVTEDGAYLHRSKSFRPQQQSQQIEAILEDELERCSWRIVWMKEAQKQFYQSRPDLN